MKIFLDSVDLEELKTGVRLGVVDGVTTNPSLIAKAGLPMADQIRAICDIVDGDVNAEVVSTYALAMIREARELVGIHKNVVVKCPMTREGIKATKALSGEGIRVNVTLCFSLGQALLAAKAGAYIVSPSVGQLDDVSWAGMDLVRNILRMYQNYGFKTQVLAESLRTPTHVVDAAMAGAHIATVPLKVLQMLYEHPFTDIGLYQFLKDYEEVFPTPPDLEFGPIQYP